MSDDKGDTRLKDIGAYAGVVKALADVLHESDLAEVEIERDDVRIRISRQMSVNPVITVPPPPPPHVPAVVRDELPPDMSQHRVVSSPMVGTVYLSPEPGADNFVGVGDTVAEGATLLLIEAMKTFNAVTAPTSGKLARILVTDGQPVEYGDALMVIE